MKELKDFMLIFKMDINPSYQPSPKELTTMKNAWGNYIGNIAQNARLVSSHQLGYEGTIIINNNETKIDFEAQKKESISGNLVVKASDLNEATNIAKACPILQAGGSVEVRNTLTIF